MKGKEAPVAKEDEEYPEWLWGLLGDKGTKGGMGDGGEGGDEFGEFFWFLVFLYTRRGLAGGVGWDVGGNSIEKCQGKGG